MAEDALRVKVRVVAARFFAETDRRTEKASPFKTPVTVTDAEGELSLTTLVFLEPVPEEGVAEVEPVRAQRMEVRSDVFPDPLDDGRDAAREGAVGTLEPFTRVRPRERRG